MQLHTDITVDVHFMSKNKYVFPVYANYITIEINELSCIACKNCSYEVMYVYGGESVSDMLMIIVV